MTNLDIQAVQLAVEEEGERLGRIGSSPAEKPAGLGRRMPCRASSTKRPRSAKARGRTIDTQTCRRAAHKAAA